MIRQRSHFKVKSLPACFYLVAQVHRLLRGCARLEVTDVEGRQGVIDEAMHGAIGAVHVLVDKPGDEVRGEGDDKGLGGDRTSYNLI